MNLKKMNYRKRRTSFIISLLLGPFFLLWLSCGQEKPQETSPGFNLKDPQKINNIILEVEDTLYFNSDFEKYIRSIVGNNQNDLTISSLGSLYDKFVDERILLKAARNKEISLTWEEKKEYLAKLTNEFRPEEKEVSLKDLDTQILFDRLLIVKYTYLVVEDIEVTEKEIKEHYNLHKGEFLQAERVKVSQILVKTEDVAIEILDKVKKSSEEEFRKIAQAYSIGTEASKGGDMGWFEIGQLPYEMEKVIFSLKEGELSQVVESSYGYHIFRLDKKYGPEIVSLEKASPGIELKLLEQKINKAMSQHIEELKKSFNWKSHPNNLPFPYERKVP